MNNVTTIHRNKNGYYSRRVNSFIKMMKEANPNIQDENIFIDIKAGKDGDEITIAIKNIDVNTDVFNLIYNTIFADEQGIEEKKTTDFQQANKDRVYSIIKDLGPNPTFLQAASAIFDCIQLLND